MRNLDRCLLVISFVACACGDDPAPSRLPYKADNTSIISGDFDNADGLTTRDVATPNGDECVNLDGVCARPQKDCGDNGAADVLLDEHGAVLDVICYPTTGVAVESFEGDVHNVGNNVVLVLDDRNDGVDVEGDVTIDGNNVTLWGHGPDTSVIGGDLHIDKNNAVVRGLRVQGDVTIDKNNPSLVDCVIEGDLTIHGNNVSIALCEVWGALVVDGNNAVLVSNRFRIVPEVTGNNLICASNRAFRDDDANHIVSADELGDAIDCSNKKADDKVK